MRQKSEIVRQLITLAFERDVEADITLGEALALYRELIAEEVAGMPLQGTGKLEVAQVATVSTEDRPTEPVPVQVKEPVPTVPGRHSRTEALFGPKETWENDREEETPRTSWYGFLYIQCEACGKRMSTFIKRANPIGYKLCTCGHQTPLRDLMFAHTKCSCGTDISCRTNVKDEEFEIPCHKCGQPMPLVMGFTGTAYVSKLRGEDSRPEDPQP